MKQKDIAVLVAAGIFSAVLSLLITNILFGSNKRELTAEVVAPISSEFKTPGENDPVFNENAINPTQLIQIGDSTKTTPF